jgi:hypothetical protein
MKCDLCKQPFAAVQPVYRRLIAHWRRYGVFCEGCAARREPLKGWLPSRPCCRCSRAVIRDSPERKSSLYFTCGHECRRAVHNAKYRSKRAPQHRCLMLGLLHSLPNKRPSELGTRRLRLGRTVRPEHAAIAREGLEPLTTALAVIEELAGIDRHRLDNLIAAFGASQCGLKLLIGSARDCP